MCVASICRQDSFFFAHTSQKLRVSQRMAELRDLVVTGLSHLVRANPLSGFKQCLHLAYDVDPQKRVIFAHVFARVLGQGTRFDHQNNSPAALRQARLREVWVPSCVFGISRLTCFNPVGQRF
jgi:hypothetical protein